MKTYKLQTVDNEGNIMNESELLLKKNSILIQKVNEPFITFKEMEYIHEQMKDSLNKDNNVITIPSFIELQILNIQN